MKVEAVVRIWNIFTRPHVKGINVLQWKTSDNTEQHSDGDTRSKQGEDTEKTPPKKRQT